MSTVDSPLSKVKTGQKIEAELGKPIHLTFEHSIIQGMTSMRLGAEFGLDKIAG